jgi:hypothetical protein
MSGPDGMPVMGAEPGWDAPYWHELVANLRAEVDRLTTERDALRRHARSLHRLNGWSKQKGWWCSCGTTIQATSISYDRSNYPWDADGRAEAIGLHVEHVDAALAAGAPVSGDGT